MNCELVLKARAALGEGPVWDDRRHVLYWVDIEGCAVHIYDPATLVDRQIDTKERVGCLAPRLNGGLVLGLERGWAALDIESQSIVYLVDPENHMPRNRFNDGKCDPQGRFWAGTMSMDKEKEAGSLYCLYPDLTFRTMITGVTTSNGLAWSSDHKTLYYIDTPTLKVVAYRYNPETGDISGKKTAVTIPKDRGKPDGMAIDEEDKIWVAHYGGGMVSRWDPKKGNLIDTVEVPAPNVTSCAFGGHHLDRLYITTARQGMDEEALKAHPEAGGLFCVEPGVKGTPTSVFAG